MKKNMLIAMAVLVIAGTAAAAQLVSEAEVMKEFFPAGGSVKKEITLTDSQVKAVNAVFGMELVPKGEEKNVYQVIAGSEGVAIGDRHKGKWGEISIIVLIDSKTGKVKNLIVTESSEKRGRPIVMKSFLKQFFGKGPEDKFSVGKNINGVSGATISSESVAFIVKRAIAINKVVQPK